MTNAGAVRSINLLALLLGKCSNVFRDLYELASLSTELLDVVAQRALVGRNCIYPSVDLLGKISNIGRAVKIIEGR